MINRPSFLWPVSRPEVTLDDAFAECVAAFADHAVPTHLCRQCFDPPWEQRIIAAARDAYAGKVPETDEYRGIYYEHPDCVGGEDTIKLFMPHGLRGGLTGLPCNKGPDLRFHEVVDKAVQAGFWFWPEEQKAAVRQIGVCLFWAWFEDGQYDWAQHTDQMDATAFGDDVLSLCSLCLIDPFDMVRILSELHTPQADSILAGPLNFSVTECTYVARDTHTKNQVYQDATAAIATTLQAREAAAFMAFITKNWTETAFFRNDRQHSQIAKDLSEFGTYYDIRMADTKKQAQQAQLMTWPTLDLIV